MPLMEESELVRYALEALRSGIEPIDVTMCSEITHPHNDALSSAGWTYSDTSQEGLVTIRLLGEEAGVPQPGGFVIMRPTSVALTHTLGRERYRIERPVQLSTVIEQTNMPSEAVVTNVMRAFARVLAPS